MAEDPKKTTENEKTQEKTQPTDKNQRNKHCGKHGRKHGNNKYRGSNDPAWWLKYPELAKDATNIAFNVINGTRLQLHGQVNANVCNLKFGILAVANLVPTVGYSASDSDAFNTQIRQLWLDMHRKYRGIGTYEKADLGIAILAIKDAFVTLSKFERIYGVINSYKIRNRVLPYGLLEALRIDKSLESDLADFRYVLNLYIKKLQQLCLPKDFSMMLADITLIGSVFKDASNDRASLFAFDTKVYGKYNPARFTSGGCVDYINYAKFMTGETSGSELAFTLDDIKRILDDVVEPLLGDDDIARMCSDLLAAYGSENVMVLGVMPEDYVIEPMDDEERKLQFHNLTRCGRVSNSYANDLQTDTDTDITPTYIRDMTTNYQVEYCIYQLNNTVRCEMCRADSVIGFAPIRGVLVGPASFTNAEAKWGEVLLDFWKDEPSDGDILVATRFTTVAKNPESDADANPHQMLDSYGSFICEDVYVYFYEAGQYTSYQLAQSLIINRTTLNNSIIAEMLLNQIDWRPITYFDNDSEMYVMGDVDQFAIVHDSTIKRIHEVCFLSGYKLSVAARE